MTRTWGILIALMLCAATATAAAQRLGLSALASAIEASEVLEVLDSYPPATEDEVRVLLVREAKDDQLALVIDRGGIIYTLARPEMRRARESDPKAPTFTRAEIRDLVAAMSKRPVALKIPKSWIVE